MHAQTIEAANWWARPRGPAVGAWIQEYQKSLTARHRDAIVAALRDVPMTSVLEVGSHCGPNLIRLAQAYPALEQLTGVDINADAIVAGQAWVRALGLTERIQMVQGRVPDLTATLATGCVDVALSCYSLAYVAPDDLDDVLYEMGRLARRAIVLAEPMSETGPAPARMTMGGYSEWAHNYQAASRWIGTLARDDAQPRRRKPARRSAQHDPRRRERRIEFAVRGPYPVMARIGRGLGR